MGTVLGGAGGPPRFDPANTVINPDEAWMRLIYGTLVRPTPDGGFEPWLAESVEVVDPTTLTVTIREGIRFTDGATYDAEAVRTGILRNLREPGSPAVDPGRHSLFKQLADITVEGPLQVTFRLSQPVAGEFVSVLAGREGAVPSPTAIANGTDLEAEPIGAGPYVLAEYQPDQVVSLRKNPDFIDAAHWQLGGIDFVHLPDARSGVTALLSGAIDMYSGLGPADASVIESDDRLELLRHYTDFSYYTINFCSTKPPFDDVRVRKAVQHAVNRDEMNALFIGGRGEPAFGFWRADSPNFEPRLPELAAYDPELSRRLLAEAGAANVTVDLAYSPGRTQRLTEIVQGQLAEVGITVNLVPARNIVSEFITPQRPGMMVNPGSRSGIDKVNKLFDPASVQNLCEAERPDIVQLTAEAATLDPNDPARVPLWQRIDQINAEGAFVVFLVWDPQLVAVDRTRVGGDLRFTETRSASVWASFESVYVSSDGR